MQQSQYITPRLGRTSVAIVTIGCMTMLFVIAQYEIQQTLTRAMLLLGLCYGVASGLCWLATVVENPFVRYVVRLIVLIATAYTCNKVGTEDWMRNLSNIGGFLIGQTLVFFTLRVPDWEASLVRPGQFSAFVEVRRQFGIGDVVIATTSIALLLAIIIRYLTPIESASYWLVMTLVWVIGPSIAACFALAALNRNVKVSIGLLLLGLMLAAGGTIGLSFADFKSGLSLPSVFSGVWLYGQITLAYVIVVVLMSISGRIQSVADPTTEARPAELNN